MTERVDAEAVDQCVAGCMRFCGGEVKHHRDCPYYPESLTKLWHDTEAELVSRCESLEAENQNLRGTLHFISGAINWEINPSNYSHDEVCALNNQWVEVGNTASAALAEQEKTDDQ